MTQWVVTGINRALPRMDVTLFLRPFKPICWILIAVTIFIVSSCILIPPWHDKNTPQKELVTTQTFSLVS